MVVEDTWWSDKKLDLFLKEHPLIRKNISKMPCWRPQSVKELPLSKWCRINKQDYVYRLRSNNVVRLDYSCTLLDFFTQQHFVRWCIEKGYASEKLKKYVITYGEKWLYRWRRDKIGKPKEMFIYSYTLNEIYSNSMKEAKDYISKIRKRLNNWIKIEVPKMAKKKGSIIEQKRFIKKSQKDYLETLKIINSFKIEINYLRRDLYF